MQPDSLQAAPETEPPATAATPAHTVALGDLAQWSGTAAGGAGLVSMGDYGLSGGDRFGLSASPMSAESADYSASPATLSVDQGPIGRVSSGYELADLAAIPDNRGYFERIGDALQGSVVIQEPLSERLMNAASIAYYGDPNSKNDGLEAIYSTAQGLTRSAIDQGKEIWNNPSSLVMDPLVLAYDQIEAGGYYLSGGLIGDPNSVARNQARTESAFNFLDGAKASISDPGEFSYLFGGAMLGLRRGGLPGPNSTNTMQAGTNVLSTERLLGARSGRVEYGTDPILSGGPLRELTNENIRISNRGIDVVEGHISRFGDDAANQVMLQRLRGIESGEIRGTVTDYNFYSHELREFTRVRRLGYETGPLPNDVYYNAHSATLREYGIAPTTYDQSLRALYHPDAIRLID
ncbi:MAG: hypothetical protein KZQ97_21750 [Candidatus Thiodiazotropha sp. (ex Dulcina madagascariensis)]|nr:hypothetical protein [Candidatus Thiodiazotropha sp. (ex Dulcina madagascariensis)]